MSVSDDSASGVGSGRTVREQLEETVISGLAVVVPVVVTLLVLDAIFGFFFSSLSTLVSMFRVLGLHLDIGTAAVYAAAVFLLFGLVLFVGALTRTRYGERFLEYFDHAFSLVPGVGAIYESFRDMSEVLVESDTRNFREVKAVEFPSEGAYTLGFVTTRTPEALQSAVGHEEMLTLFLPFAPNPVMGGHLAHVPADRVYDVDMTVEEGMRTVVTSGVAVSEPADDGETEERIADLTHHHPSQGYVEDSARSEHADQTVPQAERRERYETDVEGGGASEDDRDGGKRR